MSRGRASVQRSEGAASGEPALAPGKRTLTSRLSADRRAATPPATDPSWAVQLSGEPAAEGGDPFALHLLAQEGVAGAGGAVPYAAELQPLMPGLDLSTVRAHQGDQAQGAARAIGAQAYATGNDVALPAQPSKELVAHELAHVAQQRDGVSLAGGVGRAGDPYEQEADAIAARVASGQSAADLMPAAVGGRGHAGAVQRQAAGEHEAAQAGDDFQPGEDEVAGWLDLKWIDTLPPRMHEQIDGSFAVGKESAAYKKALAKDSELRDIQRQKETAKQAVFDATAAELGTSKKKAVKKDQGYKDGVAAVDAEWADEKQARLDAVKAEVATKGKKGVSWEQGRLAARTNFMSWGTSLLGSADAVKAHFSGLEKVSDGAYLSAPAAARFNQAAAWFESSNPGSKFPGSGVGQALRGRHQGAHAKGLQGHPLGLSLDFDAYVNVHQKDGVASFMLRKFGGGPNQLELGKGSFGKVQEMGKASAAGEDLSGAQLAYLAEAEAAYDAMAATSENFKHALGDNEAKLKEVQAVYYSVVQPGNKAVAELEKQLEKARKAAKKRVGKDGAGGEVDADPEVAALIERRDAKLAEFEGAKAEVTAAMQEVFAPWIADLQAEITAIEGQHEREDLDAAVDYKTAARVHKEVKKVGKDHGKLRKLLKKHAAIFVGLDAGFADADFDTVKAAAVQQAAQVEAAKYQSGEIKTRLELIRRFNDPRAVFGQGQYVKKDKKDKHSDEMVWEQKREVGQPPIMQYLETGFARDDKMGTNPEADKEVFNGEFVAAMMRFGWYPGAAWGAVDTMHFDFRDGFDAIVGGAKSFGPTD